jgi:hypothetical protein
MVWKVVFLCALLCAPIGAIAAPTKPAPKPASTKAAPAKPKAAPAVARKPKPAAKPAPKPALFTKDGTLTREGLATLAFSAAGRESDKFETNDLGRQVIGREFIFAQSLADEDSSTETNDAYWRYDKSAQQLTLSFRSYVHSLYLKFESKKSGEYTGQNAFGVKVRIKGYTETEAKLTPVGGTDFNTLSVTLNADPVEGRRLSQEVTLLVQGVIDASSDGAVTSCSDDHAGATIDDPIEVYTYSCAVTGRVTHVEFYDRKNSATLAEWNAEPAAAAKP